MGFSVPRLAYQDSRAKIIDKMDTPNSLNNHNLVHLVILNWNAAEDTLACLRHIAEWRQIQPRVWIVDNHSEAEDFAQLQRGLAQFAMPCEAIRNPRNMGFAGGTNCGMRAALMAGNAPLLLLNNDAHLNDQDVARLLATLEEHPEAGVIGPALYTAASPPQLLSAGNRDPAYHLHTLITDPPRAATVYEVDYISGSAALIRADLLHKIGLLDEDYFFHTEVADLCKRARAAGYRTLVDLRAAAYHNLERSSPLRSTLYTYYLVRNRLVYIRKIYPARMWWLGIFWSAYTLLLAIKLRLQGQPAAARAVYLALGDGLTGRWGGQNQRILAQSHAMMTQQLPAKS
jgi:GT2 family glycosyltransferase